MQALCNLGFKIVQDGKISTQFIAQQIGVSHSKVLKVLNKDELSFIDFNEICLVIGELKRTPHIRFKNHCLELLGELV